MIEIRAADCGYLPDVSSQLSEMESRRRVDVDSSARPCPTAALSLHRRASRRQPHQTTPSISLLQPCRSTSIVLNDDQQLRVLLTSHALHGGPKPRYSLVEVACSLLPREGRLPRPSRRARAACAAGLIASCTCRSLPVLHSVAIMQ